MRFSIEAKPSQTMVQVQEGIPGRTALNQCYKHTAGEDQNQYVRIAAQVSGNDLDFLALLDAENGLWTPDRKHSTNTDGSSDYGLCGINKKWHPEIVNDERFFTDPRWQIEQCYKLYIGGTTFYGKSKIWQTKKHFTCS